MEIIKSLLDFVMHIDEHLMVMISDYGTLIYAILFLIVFVETGLIVMPFLPGDSLLFAAGALAAANNNEGLNIAVLIPLLIVAALCGDNVNYFVGKFLSDQIRKRERILFFKREYITRTEAFYEKYGRQAIIMARFVPIVRTVAPFVAGASHMPYRRYITFCILGAILWVVSISLLGYTCGNIPIIKENFEIVVFVIIGVSLLPIVIGLFKAKFSKSA
ncbi:MAG: DedA family protein [Flavobacteriales bacterium]|nr:DedA family protein [Flavobacteriales bacterium]